MDATPTPDLPPQPSHAREPSAQRPPRRAPDALLARELPPVKTWPPKWELFEEAFHVRVKRDAAGAVGFRRMWIFLTAREYRRRSMDNARKRMGKEGRVQLGAEPEVRWLGRGRPLARPPTTAGLWDLIQEEARRAGIHIPEAEAEPSAPQQPLAELRSESDPRFRGEPLPLEDD